MELEKTIDLIAFRGWPRRRMAAWLTEKIRPRTATTEKTEIREITEKTADGEKQTADR